MIPVSRTKRSPLLAAAAAPLAAVLLALAAGAARGESTTTCPAVQVGEELKEPPVIQAEGGGIDTTFRVETRTLCVPVQNSDNTWTATAMDLRTYVYPDPDKPGEWRWGYPGPTLRVRKPSTPDGKGDSLAILLVNNLTSSSNDTCDNACQSGVTCPTDTSKLPDAALCPKTNDPLCCCWVNVNQTWPDCFHGDNSTNLHFHGSHVSPQPPQDYVLLELRPKADEGKSGAHAAHGRGQIAYGQYPYRVQPFPWTQAEGTHWYHPHKHGSVSLQVANGMPGALLIEGPFDDWLRAYYGGRLVEKLLVMQQIQQDTNLFVPGAPAPAILVNGQVTPKVTMRPGEVQRWRFVNATMQVAAQVSVDFPDDATARQIAMDGVQFAPENYQRQPLFSPSDPTVFQISPGNRADFLVQAPTAAGTYHLTHRVFGNVSEHTKEKLQKRAQALLAATKSNTADAPLLTLVVEVAKAGAAAAATGFPPVGRWPKMPPYLADIRPDEIKQRPNLTFSMSAGPGNPATEFFINDIQYDSDCVNVTTTLDTADEWTVKNTSPLGHPFHIHTNPFQVIQNGTTTYKPPYVWQDTIALPAGTTASPGSVLLRHRYTEFTGEYVLHCHFLGHEDRGMMFGVQTVCPKDPQSFGKARPNNEPECVPGNLIPAAPQCPPTTSTSTGR